MATLITIDLSDGNPVVTKTCVTAIDAAQFVDDEIDLEKFAVLLIADNGMLTSAVSLPPGGYKDHPDLTIHWLPIDEEL